MTTKRKLLAMLGSVALLSAVPVLASAHTHVFLGINLGGLFAPAPVVYAPPPVVYAPPRVVYVPRVRYGYYAPRGYYVPGSYYDGTVYVGRRGWRHHEYRDHDHWDHDHWGHWRHHDDDDNDDQQ